MTADEALSALLHMDRSDLEAWCKEAYFDIFATTPGKWLCKYTTEKLIAWFLMFYLWDIHEQEWKFIPAVERFVDLSE